MSTKMVIGLVVLLVVIGGGAMILSGNSEDRAGTMESGEGGTAGAATFGALIAQGGSRTCTVSMSNEGTQSQGVIYVSDGKVRGDFTTTANGQTMTGHMIQAEGYMYSWSDAAPQGVKMSLSQAQQTDAGGNQPIDPSANVDYDCSAWSPDQSKFTPPSNVAFMELNASGGMMPR